MHFQIVTSEHLNEPNDVFLYSYLCKPNEPRSSISSCISKFTVNSTRGIHNTNFYHKGVFKGGGGGSTPPEICRFFFEK